MHLTVLQEILSAGLPGFPTALPAGGQPQSGSIFARGVATAAKASFLLVEWRELIGCGIRVAGHGEEEPFSLRPSPAESISFALVLFLRSECGPWLTREKMPQHLGTGWAAREARRLLGYPLPLDGSMLFRRRPLVR
jgi:hypothetical protein